MTVDELTFELKHYRCFFEGSQAKLRMRKGGITALVGPNNSGKSALMRAMYELRPYLQIIWSYSWESDPISGTMKSFGQAANQFASVQDPADIAPSKPTQPRRIEYVLSTNQWKLTSEHSQPSLYEVRRTFEYTGDWEARNNEMVALQQMLPKVVYLGPFRNIALEAVSGTASHYGLPVGSAFVANWAALKNGPQRESRQAVTRTERAIGDLLGFRGGVQINASHDGKSLQLVIDGTESVTLADVGAGVAQLIFSVITAATQKPFILLIDEPELNLHPAMQVKFIEALQEHVEFAIVMATHSLGLARQVADEILLVTQDRDTGKSNAVPLEHVKNGSVLLAEMGYSQFASLGGKALLLVEGVTEVFCFRQWLRKLGKVCTNAVLRECAA